MHEELYHQLQKLGFSQYESKAYVTLLQHSSITGYEVSKRSSVPRSMIYEVLGKLIDKGAAYIVPSDPVKYAPVPAKEMLARVQKEFSETVEYLESTLHSLESQPDMEVIVHIDGYEQVVQEMLGIIKQAKHELWLSVWEPQVSHFQKAVNQAAEKNIPVFSIVFGAENETLGRTFHHNYMLPEVVKDRIGGYLTIAARDGEEVVIANFMDESLPRAVKTKNPALVLVATEYIRHDIMIEEITREFGAERLDTLWRSRPDLYQVVTGKRFNVK
ncbi:TrmB family transcriptional regulator [Bacillus songklensis]|uniref:TrmB family transcriptional regulator n=1 Tax=Bacillus songklensis TaxID=1069116 RepID=A0ABV8AYY3_9BACI